MTEPTTITVQLPEPAGADVQALAACELVLGQLHRRQGLPLDNDPHFKARVVAWLAEKYLDEKIEVRGPASPTFMARFGCRRCGKSTWQGCTNVFCPMQGSANG